MRDHPIPKVTEPFQYRAIGLVRGTYNPEGHEIFTRGKLVDLEGQPLDSVVLGRVMTLMRRHLNIETPHLWVVYPRCREVGQLHLQIAGIWEPSTLNKSCETDLEEGNNTYQSQEALKDELPEGDGYFSIRGELIFTKPETNDLIVKVRQLARTNRNRALPFKVQLKGSIPLENLRKFVSLDVRRNGQFLHLEAYDVIGEVLNRGGKKRGRSSSSSRNK